MGQQITYPANENIQIHKQICKNQIFKSAYLELNVKKPN